MEDKQKNESMFQKVFGFVFACMGPILPGMLGTGMVKVLLSFLATKDKKPLGDKPAA